MIDGGEYSTSSAVVANSECYTSLNTRSKKRRSRIKKRFSDDQIRSLETIFESESKLEPRKKLQLAKELELQPRQVAIWFQNQRARRKSKQLERDYSILQANYKSLVSQFEALKKEKQSLVIQLQKLRGPMDKSAEESWCFRQGQARNITDGKSHNGNIIKAEFEVKPSLPLDGSEDRIGVFSDDNRSIKTEYLGFEEEPDLLNMVEPADDSLTSPENWGSLDSNGLLDQSSNSYQWWDFWS